MSISYAETRDNEQLRLLTPAIDAFITRAQNPLPTGSACPRQTVFFFPGGLASRLLRATQRFQDGLTVPQTFNYDVAWVTYESLAWGAARDLKMHRDSTGVFRDRGDRIIVANGVILDLLYDGFVNWCANNNLDLFVVDWDWRRRLEETANFFVRKLLPFFRARVLAAGLPDPLATFSLIGHSFGGMVINLILRGNDPIVANLARAITVATPFYGYHGQVHRWFEGDELVNGPFNIFQQDMMEVIASLPGLYSLHFLDESTYSEAATQQGLTVLDPSFPLASYPSMDATIGTLRADAYNPQTNGNLVRYPGMTGFDLGELDYARMQFLLMTAPMAANLSAKFYNIRGVCTESDEQTPINNTPGSVTWDWIPTNFASTDPSPIVNGANVPGDDTQPAWTARLATNAAARCITVRGSNINHMMIMNLPQILDALASILCAPGAAMKPSVPTPPEPASDQDLIAFMRWLHTQRKGKIRWPRFNDPAMRELVPSELREKLPAITLRIMMDIMKRPAPPGLSGPARPPQPKRRGGPKTPGPKPTGRRPAPKGRRRRPAR